MQSAALHRTDDVQSHTIALNLSGLCVQTRSKLQSVAHTDDARLKAHFSKAVAAAGGILRAASVSRKKDAGPDGKPLSKGFGFVECSSDAVARAVMTRLQVPNCCEPALISCFVSSCVLYMFPCILHQHQIRVVHECKL